MKNISKKLKTHYRKIINSSKSFTSKKFKFFYI